MVHCHVPRFLRLTLVFTERERKSRDSSYLWGIQVLVSYYTLEYAYITYIVFVIGRTFAHAYESFHGYITFVCTLSVSEELNIICVASRRACCIHS